MQDTTSTNDLPPNDNEPLYYTAVGASAGGLEALQEFFQNVAPDTGLAFIVIQHLSPDFKSVMDELLGRCTKMAIYHAADGVKVKPNTIYLIPSRKTMMIAEGKLILVDQMPNSGLNFPIDIFFRSLAEDQHHRSIGIVLSGTGSDGSRGLQAIKEVGGLVMVQEPTNAKFDGMPYNAVKTGLADVVADANELPAKLIQFITHPMISNQDASLVRQVEDNDASFKEIFKLLKERSDIDFTQYKPTTVARRIERRMGVNGLVNLKDYYALLLKQPKEIQVLSKDMLIGVTRFFRDDEAFHVLRQQIIPKILNNISPGDQIRVWVAGCSTGEEAYSIAILFDEAMKERGEIYQTKIFATDVDPDAIAEASTGKFDISIQDDISEERVNRYFTQEGDILSINAHIRQMVVFATHNLINDPPFSNTHLTVCRNVLIYFQPETQKRVLSMLHFSLRKDGYLFLGCSESLGSLQRYFETIHERSRLFKKSVNTRLMLHSFQNNSHNKYDRKLNSPNVEQLLKRYQNRHNPIASSPVIESLLEDYVPACIILNSELEVLFAFGDVTPYTRKFKTGEFSSNIKQVIVEELSTVTSTAIQRAMSSEKTVLYESVVIQKNDGIKLEFDLKVKFVPSNSLATFQLALLFEQCKTLESSESEVLQYNVDIHKQQRIVDLENELQRNQECLQVTVEELESTNEELQSSNEELLAANEELQSTNEELQSVNEELYTVNSEYQDKIEEITKINSDLDNIMKSTDVGILFLDQMLLIRNYNPAATRVINLLKSDIGRPFHHISHKLKSSTLLQDIANVIENKQPFQQELRTEDSNLVLIKITPYVIDKKSMRGCVIAITDVTETRLSAQSTEAQYNKIEHLIYETDNAAVKEATILNLLTNQMSEQFATLLDALNKQSSNQFALQKHPESALTYENVDICVFDSSDLKHPLFSKITSLDKPPALLIISEDIHSIDHQPLNQFIVDVLDKKSLTGALLESSIKHLLTLKRISHCLTP